MTIFPGEPASASFIRAKDDGGGGDNWNYKTNQHWYFLQASCPSCHPSNSVKALNVNILKVTYLFITLNRPT